MSYISELRSQNKNGIKFHKMNEENYNVNVHGFEIENRDILESINKPQS